MIWLKIGDLVKNIISLLSPACRFAYLLNRPLFKFFAFLSFTGGWFAKKSKKRNLEEEKRRDRGVTTTGGESVTLIE